MFHLSDLESIKMLLEDNPQIMKELLSTNIVLSNNFTFRENVEHFKIKYKIEQTDSMENSIRNIEAKSKIDYSPLQLDYMKKLSNSDEFIDSLDIPENVKSDIKWMILRLNDPKLESPYNMMMFAVLQENEPQICAMKLCNKNWEKTMGFLCKKK
jgi:hypothetical protein